jgi:uncharacterized Zn-finger protein
MPVSDQHPNIFLAMTDQHRFDCLGLSRPSGREDPQH